MGRRDVTVYTCNGCRAVTTVDRDKPAPGFHRVRLPNFEVWLCTVCYGAVEWVTRFQGVTVPPRVYGVGVNATLRRPA